MPNLMELMSNFSTYERKQMAYFLTMGYFYVSYWVTVDYI